jgi:hypothetical protein
LEYLPTLGADSIREGDQMDIPARKHADDAGAGVDQRFASLHEEEKILDTLTMQ